MLVGLKPGHTCGPLGAFRPYSSTTHNTEAYALGAVSTILIHNTKAYAAENVTTVANHELCCTSLNGLKAYVAEKMIHPKVMHTMDYGKGGLNDALGVARRFKIAETDATQPWHGVLPPYCTMYSAIPPPLLHHGFCHPSLDSGKHWELLGIGTVLVFGQCFAFEAASGSQFEPKLQNKHAFASLRLKAAYV
jgi:hypothetical protein